MAARAPYAPSPRDVDDVLARVLAMAERAPLVPLTGEEEMLLAEVEGKPMEWTSHEDLLATLSSNATQ